MLNESQKSNELQKWKSAILGCQEQQSSLEKTEKDSKMQKKKCKNDVRWCKTLRLDSNIEWKSSNNTFI